MISSQHRSFGRVIRWGPFAISVLSIHSTLARTNSSVRGFSADRKSVQSSVTNIDVSSICCSWCTFRQSFFLSVEALIFLLETRDVFVIISMYYLLNCLKLHRSVREAINDVRWFSFTEIVKFYITYSAYYDTKGEAARYDSQQVHRTIPSTFKLALH